MKQVIPAITAWGTAGLLGVRGPIASGSRRCGLLLGARALTLPEAGSYGLHTEGRGAATRSS